MTNPTWTPYQMQRLRDLWPTKMTAKQIACDIFNDEKKRAACIGKSRRMNLQNKRSPITPIQWEDKRFIRMWTNGVALSHMSEVFKCSTESLRQHARDLKLQARGKGHVVRHIKPPIYGFRGYGA